MARANTTAAEVKSEAKQVAASHWIEQLTRLGFIARGVIYGLIGILALRMAFGNGSQPTGPNGAMAAIAAQPFGKFLLLLLAIGLAGYSLWGFIRALLDPKREGSDAPGLGKRLGYLFSGLSYAGLFLIALQFVLGSGSSQAGKTQELTARVLHLPFGPWIVGIAGLAFLLFGGLYQIYFGYTAKFREDFKSYKMDPDERQWAMQLGRFGYVARGVAFAIIGFFLIQAAVYLDPNQAKGLDDALGALARQPYGPVMLAAVALGLVAFGVFSILMSRWSYTTERLRQSR